MDLEKWLLLLATSMVIFLLYVMFIFIPVHLYNETKCLEKGYPVTNTTVTLTGYCMNLEGAITTKVDKL